MPRPTARIAFAIFVNIVAGIPLVMLARAETVTAENCLSSPKNETPAGSHWYYRADHVNKRNCWYLRREGDGVAQTLPQASPQTPSPTEKPSFADARAELRPRTTAREDNAAASPPANSAIVNPVGAAGNGTASASSAAWNATAAVATRWPELPPASTAQSDASTATADASDNAAPPQAEALTAALPVASIADWPASIRPEMIPTLIAAAIGALAFAAAAAALISRRYRRRHVRRRKATSARGPIWETTDDDRIVLSDYPAMDDRDYRPRFARGVASAASRKRVAEYAQRPPRRARR